MSAEVKESLEAAMAFTPHDWTQHHRLAWIWGIVLGWDDAMPEMASKHRWDAETVARLERLHAEFKAIGDAPVA